MRRWRRIACLMLSVLLAVSLAGCGQQKAEEGLSLQVSIGSAPVTLDPIRAEEESDLTVLEHLYENLMKVAADASGGTTVTSGMAKSYDVDKNNDGTVTYTFHLRNAKWSDGKSVTAENFVYAWRRLADPASQSPNAHLLEVVKGFDQVRETGDVTQLAVEAKNDSTLLVTLNSACEWFLTDVCTAAATMPLREDVVQKLKTAALETNQQIMAAGGEATQTWSSNYTALVTNGAYRVRDFDENSMTLAANTKYTGTVSGPTEITFHYADSPETSWSLYEAGEVDIVAPLSRGQVEQHAADSKYWSMIPELNTYTLLFNTQKDPFSDPMARLAFAQVIDRETLSQVTGLGTTPATGLVPYGVPDEGNVDFRTHGGDLVTVAPEDYAQQCREAQELLSEAGYDASETVEYIYVDGGSHADTAKALAEMWTKQLGVSVEVRGLSEEEFQLALESGEYELAGTDLRSSVNDAEGFLDIWTSDSDRNVVGYENSAYDTLLTVINSAMDETARRGCLHDAESLLLADCPLTPLYFTNTAYEVRQGLTGVCRDPRGFFSFATVAETTE